MADEMRFERRMSDMDALMWEIEKDPALRSTITAVALLDRSPDRARLQDKIDRAARVIPRMRQRVVSAPFSLAPPRWVVDPHFSLDYHVRWVRAPGTGSLHDVLSLAEPIAMQGFDRARPLWEFTIVEGLADGRAALVQKVHHAITDGVGGIKMAMMLLDIEREPSYDPGPLPEAPEAERPSPAELVLSDLGHEYRRRAGIARRTLARGADAVRNPIAATRRTAESTASIARLLAPAFDPLSPLMTDRSLQVRFRTLAAPLPEMKAAAKQVGGKLNDAFVAAVAGGLRRYHESHGRTADELRMTMPINIRTGETEALAGNQFVPARFSVPVGIADPLERMAAIKDLVQRQRSEPGLGFTEAVAGILTRLPTTVTTQLFGSMLKGIDFITSNVPGSPIPVFVAGARIDSQYAFGPLTGAALNATLLSYGEELHVGINRDPAAIPDGDAFMACLEEGFDEIRKLA